MSFWRHFRAGGASRGLMAAPRYKMPPQSLDRRGFPEDAPAQTSELGGVTTKLLVKQLLLVNLHRPLSSEGLRLIHVV